jgi:type VI protein secretion system component Hcp
MIFVMIPGMGDDAVQTASYDNKKWFVADSFSFGIEREMKESGEKGGTVDVNIGVGEMQECTISKSMDWASPMLAQFAVNGNSPGTAEIDFVEVAGGGDAAGEASPMCYLKYKLDRCFVKSWSISGDADDRPTEEVAFYYNKIGFSYARTIDGKNWESTTPMGWDNTTHKKWAGIGISFDDKTGFASQERS